MLLDLPLQRLALIAVPVIAAALLAGLMTAAPGPTHGSGIAERATLLSAALEGQRLGEAFLIDAVRGAGQSEGVVAVALVDRAGRALAVSPEAMSSLDWSVAVSAASSAQSTVQEVSVSGRPLEMATRVLDDRGYHIVVVGESTPNHWQLLRGLFAFLLVLIASSISLWASRFVVLQQVADELQSFTSLVSAQVPHLSRSHVQSASSEAALTVGPASESLQALGDLVLTHQEAEKEARSQVAALLQINPNYVLFVTADGRLIDANPAFYAATGLEVAEVRDGRATTLDRILPMKELLEKGVVSQTSQAAVFGIEETFFGRDDQLRPVECAVRSVTVGGVPGLVVQATDRGKERRLSAQVDAFSDTLDLMVDQRVARITQGQSSNESALADAGLAYAIFEMDGRTRVWNEGMKRLTGVEHHEVLDAEAVAAHLCSDPNAARSLSEWIADDDPAPFYVRGPGNTDLFLRRARSQADGRSRWVVVALPLYVGGVDREAEAPTSAWHLIADECEATTAEPVWPENGWAMPASGDGVEEAGDGHNNLELGPFVSEPQRSPHDAGL